MIHDTTLMRLCCGKSIRTQARTLQVAAHADCMNCSKCILNPGFIGRASISVMVCCPVHCINHLGHREVARCLKSMPHMITLGNNVCGMAGLPNLIILSTLAHVHLKSRTPKIKELRKTTRTFIVAFNRDNESIETSLAPRLYFSRTILNLLR